MSDRPVIADRYQSDYLFLLVGTNPLPNFVAAKLLLKPEGELYLVHSRATQPVAERLARYWTEKEKRARPQYVCVDEADGADIRRNIEYVLNSIGNGHIGLNYTGGTKTMSVHACQTLLRHQEAQRRHATLSYLDARSNKMYIEHGSDQPFASESVLYKVKPSLRDIVELHAFKLVSGIDKQAMLPHLAEALAQAHQSQEAGKAWRTWCDNVLRKLTRTKKGSDWDSESMLKNVRLPLPDSDSLRDFVSKIRGEFCLSQEEDTLLLVQAAQQSNIQKVRHLCEWLDGKWLEHYVLDCVSRIQTQCGIHDVGMGIRPKSEEDRPEYDIDIGVMQGYRLYAISCATDADPGMCKLKLFEAYLRARNMAGDEAYVALVCMADNPEKIERQVGRSWDAAGKVRVFGRTHLDNLSDHLKEWFLSAGSQ
ncbi:MAG: DUF1887 family CARF protein [Roseiflexaceae bacterium]|nr:DUF1887 family CARF protein [Roseiflexaceae bacterium]